MNKDDALEEFKDRIKKYEGIIKVVLFGSYARGTESKESDIDILIIAESRENEEDIVGEAVEVLLKTGEYISVKLISQGEFTRMKNSKFMEYITEEGMTIG
jgi:predicted nucleotidyltransferase